MNTCKDSFRIILAATLTVLAVSCGKDAAESVKPDVRPEPTPGLHSFTISAGTEDSDTRAVLDGYDYKWESDDKVGLAIIDASTSTVVAGNVPLTSDPAVTYPTSHTTFTGQLIQMQIDQMSSDKTYNYYSWFPYYSGSGYPNVQFSLPDAYTVTEFGKFPKNLPMVAEAKMGLAPIVYLDGQVLEHNDLEHFDYKHVLSYAAIEVYAHPFSLPVTSIRISSPTPIAGTMTYNVTDNTYSLSGSNSITINFDTPVTADNEGLVYIPMPPGDMTGHTLTVTYSTASGPSNYIAKSIKGADFAKGKVHKLSLAPTVSRSVSGSQAITKTGYYYIEAWGGDGGNGMGGAAGGTSQRVAGMYQFTSGQTIHLYLGMAGTTATSQGSGTQPAGGTNGISLGYGGAGGNGGTSSLYPHGGKGGGGGAGTFIFLNSTSITDIRLVSGGGGGGGGRGYAINGQRDGGNGGKGGVANVNGHNGDKGLEKNGGDGGKGTGTGGLGCRGAGDGNDAPLNSNGNGGNGGEGNDGTPTTAGGAGGGGGGGGYVHGGGGGGGGFRTTTYSIAYGDGDAAGGGGGGAGGASYVTGNVANPPGFTLPTNSRSSGGDGYVVITYIRYQE